MDDVWPERARHGSLCAAIHLLHSQDRPMRSIRPTVAKTAIALATVRLPELMPAASVSLRNADGTKIGPWPARSAEPTLESVYC